MALNIRRQEKPILNRLSILLYGESKVGKTRMAAQFPNPLILSCEPHGTDFLVGADIVDIPNLEVLMSSMAEASKMDYTTLMLDGITTLVNREAARIASGSGSGKQRHGQQVYGEVTRKFNDAMMVALRSGKIIVATGHSRTTPIEGETYRVGKDEFSKVNIGLDVNPALADDLLHHFSIVCYCFTSTKGPLMLTKPINDGKRVIDAGDRTGSLPVQMQMDTAQLFAALRKLTGNGEATNGKKEEHNGRMVGRTEENSQSEPSEERGTNGKQSDPPITAGQENGRVEEEAREEDNGEPPEEEVAEEVGPPAETEEPSGPVDDGIDIPE